MIYSTDKNDSYHSINGGWEPDFALNSAISEYEKSGICYEIGININEEPNNKILSTIANNEEILKTIINRISTVYDIDYIGVRIFPDTLSSCVIIKKFSNSKHKKESIFDSLKNFLKTK